ncbi:hypothetical protein OH491_15525 [Termitidicoccus mucosus]
MIANFLDILDDGAGAHRVHLDTHGTEPAGPNIALELIHTGGTLSTFDLVGGRIETELTSLELMRGDGSAYIPDPHGVPDRRRALTPPTPSSTPPARSRWTGPAPSTASTCAWVTSAPKTSPPLTAATPPP